MGLYKKRGQKNREKRKAAAVDVSKKKKDITITEL